jgi:tRNA threonylcarbamoyl adenosine modification protein YjeE
VALSGDLGAGKTSLARGIAAGFGIAGRIQSPSFVIAQVHEGPRGRLVHADLYRIGDASELEAIGFGEMLDGALAVVEWAERFPEALPADRLWVQLSDEGEGRRARITATGPIHQAILEAL